MAEVLRRIIAANRGGARAAIPSVCTAHPQVLAASLMRAQTLDRPIVVEATSNQVNHLGGYTGMTPADFVAEIGRIADQSGTDRARITLGGDHLGPQVWRARPPEAAMDQARRMVAAYAAAGFTKIHLDCSEGCAGEPDQLPDAVTAMRSADLARVALDAAPDPAALLFVIGTEVPPPGGARTDAHGAIAPTQTAAARATLAAHGDAFTAAGLAEALPQIGGLVVQPGVEFSPMSVHHLPRDRDPGLLAALEGWPGVTLEAHSTDYQHPDAYPRLAQLGFAFLKVGPALTFAWRRALYALEQLSVLMGEPDDDGLRATMEQVMLADPRYWQGHYRGDAASARLQRHFGLADRIRYYWPRPEAQRAVARLFGRLERRDLPDPLLWQVFAPQIIERAATLPGHRPQALALASVQMALDPYYFGPNYPDEARAQQGAAP